MDQKMVYHLLVLLLFGVCFTELLLVNCELDESSIIERFREYLRIPSTHPNPDYSQTTRFILSQAREIGVEAQILTFVEEKPLILLTWVGENPSLPSVLFNSHTDVVPAELQKWMYGYGPFDANIDSHGNIFARGSQDMKCVGMQYLESLRVLKSMGFMPKRNLHLLFVPDEEIGGQDGMAEFVESSHFSDLNIGVVLDEGVVSPTNLYRVFNGERSAWWFVIKATGFPGHGSKLYDNSAMENLMISMESISKFRQVQFDLIKQEIASAGEVISINLAYLKAGTPTPNGFIMNLQPSEAEAGFDMRVPPNTDLNSLEERIRKEWAPASRNMTCQFKLKQPLVGMDQRPLVTLADRSNPWWTLLQEAVAEAGGELGKPEILFGSTDARYIRAKGIPAFGFSPIANTPILLHDHNEFLNKEQYLKGIQVYVQIMKSFSSFEDIQSF